jgi:D-alanine--poly(phosphoribitol) ligase subunit 1
MSFLKSVFSHLQNNTNPAICINGKFWSYLDLKKKVINLQLHWVENHDKGVLIVAHDHIDTYAAILACWSMGKFYVPIHPTYPKERVESIKSVFNSEYIFNPLMSDVPEIASDTNKLSFSTINEEDSWAYVLFTSGSTGEPKGVPISWNNLESFIIGFNDLGYVLSSEDRFLQMFDLTFDMSVLSFCVPLMMGACLYTVAHNSIKYAVIAELIESQRLTFAAMVPSILTYLQPYFKEINGRSLRYSLFAGEALYSDITAQWSQCVPNAQIDNLYGPTENTIVCTRYTFDRSNQLESQGVLSIGKEMKGSRCAIWDDFFQEVPNFASGNLWLSGSYLTSGYINRTDLNQAQFVINQGVKWYNTGDVARRGEDGNLFYVGRQDSQLKIQGYRIESAEIEFQLKKILPEGMRIVVIGVPNDRGIMELIAVAENYLWNVQKIKKHLANWLPPYMIPVRFVSYEQFPLNGNGKVDRKQISAWLKMINE